MTINFYNNNANNFFISTVDVDISSIQKIFLSYLEKGMHILDAGCGSGRDSRYFLKNGFVVSAFDASEALASRASEYIGQTVEVTSFQDFKTNHCYDAIWACASLLHVPGPELSSVFDNLSRHLKKGGIFYCSFKYGNTDVESQGRYFTNADEDRINNFIHETSLFIKKLWISDDVRSERSNEKWLNVILFKK